MSKEPTQIAKETLERINKELLRTKRKVALKEQEVMAKLNKYLEEAYADVSVQDKTALYKAFALQLHPDQFSKKHPKLAEYLEQLNIADGPFKILNRLNAEHLVNDVKNNPTAGFNSLLQYLIYLINPMKEKLDRYYQPVKFLANSVYWALIALITVAAVVGVISLMIAGTAIFIANSLINWTLKLVTNDQYNKEVRNYLEPNFEEYKSAYLKSIREARDLSDEQLYEEIINQKLKEVLHKTSPFGLFDDVDEEVTAKIKEQIRESLKQEILNSVDIGGFTRLKLTVISLYKSITKPFDEDNSNILVSLLLIRPLKVLISPFILGAAATVELSRFALIGIVLAGVLASTLVLAGSLAIMNIPLFALDVCRYAARKIFECDCIKENNDELSEELDNEDHPSLLMLEWHPELQNSAEPPIHYGPLFGSPKPQRKVNEHTEQENLSCNFS